MLDFSLSLGVTLRVGVILSMHPLHHEEMHQWASEKQEEAKAAQLPQGNEVDSNKHRHTPNDHPPHMLALHEGHLHPLPTLIIIRRSLGMDERNLRHQ